MTPPIRIQLKRTRGWRMPAGTVRCCRPGILGNPFQHPDPTEAVKAYRRLCTDGDKSFAMSPDGLRFASSAHQVCLSPRWPQVLRTELLPRIRGRNLGCWCAPGAACHVDVLLELANA